MIQDEQPTLAQRLRHIQSLYDEDQIETSDNDQGPASLRTEHGKAFPQSIEGPYELYDLFDDGFDGPGLVGCAAQVLSELDDLVDEQAEDEGLWFIADHLPEAYLQQELRRLHKLIEDGRHSFRRKGKS